MIEKAIITNLDTDKEIPVMYNPNQYSYGRTMDIKHEKGAGLSFNQVNYDDFSVELFYDTYETGTDVHDKLVPLEALMMPTVDQESRKTPPTCMFSWGSFCYIGFITSIKQNFIMFLSTGIPVRAKVTVTFKASFTEKENTKRSGNEACRKHWKVTRGDRLDLLAAKLLMDPKKWRLIAQANDVSDPLAFPEASHIGQTIVIPDVSS